MERKKKPPVADDFEHIHNSLAMYLSADEVDIIHASDGKETLKLSGEQLPDPIVLYILMPLVDGRDI